jgi:hypothetical protein
MGNTKELLLAYPSMKQVTLSRSVNVILPPQFYTVKKEALPLRYAYQAKKIASSIFDGLLQEGKEYDYMVWKEDDKWVFLAYDIEMISTFLQSKGFALENVGKVFFAQQFVKQFEKPLLLGNNQALVVLDDMVAVVPSAVLSEEINSTLELDHSFTPKKGVVLHGNYGSMLSKKHAWVAAAVLMLFSVMFFVEGSRYGSYAEEGENKMQEMLAAYPSLQSKYTRESIVNKYKTIDAIERKKRDLVKMVSGMIFKGVTLTSLKMDEKMLKADFTCKDAQTAERVKALAKKNQFNLLPISGSNDVKIEGAL